MVGDELRRPHFAVAELRVLVDVAPPGDDLGHHLVDAARDVLRGGRRPSAGWALCERRGRGSGDQQCGPEYRDHSGFGLGNCQGTDRNADTTVATEPRYPMAEDARPPESHPLRGLRVGREGIRIEPMERIK